MRPRLLLTVFCAALALTASPLAHPQNSEVVRYDAASLARPEGVSRLYRHIASAARDVCDSGERGLSFWVADRRCEREAIQRAIEDVGSPELTAYYEERRGERKKPIRVAEPIPLPEPQRFEPVCLALTDHRGWSLPICVESKEPQR